MAMSGLFIKRQAFSKAPHNRKASRACDGIETTMFAIAADRIRQARNINVQILTIETQDEKKEISVA